MNETEWMEKLVAAIESDADNVYIDNVMLGSGWFSNAISWLKDNRKHIKNGVKMASRLVKDITDGKDGDAARTAHDISSFIHNSLGEGRKSHESKANRKFSKLKLAKV